MRRMAARERPGALVGAENVKLLARFLADPTIEDPMAVRGRRVRELLEQAARRSGGRD